MRRFTTVTFLLFFCFSSVSRNILVGAFVPSYNPSTTADSSTFTKRQQLQLSSESNDGLIDAEINRRQVFERAAGAMAATSSGLWLPGAVQMARADSDTILPATKSSKVPLVRLGNSNLEVSRTIQGYWQLAGGHGRYRESDAIDNMKAHYDAGITTLDTADIYGPSELIVGKFVGSQPGAIPCTKFCCFRYLEEITREEVKQRIQRACERLQVSKLPLVQFFWSNYDVKR